MTQTAEPTLSGYERAAALGRFARDLSRDAVPLDVWDYARTVVLDTVGCIVGGVSTAPAQPILEVTRSLAGRPEASVPGTDIVTDCVAAAAANAYLADILDFEDTLVSHPSAAAVPAALGVGERVGATGADVVLAVIAAYEVGVRVQRAMMPSFDRRQGGGMEWAWKAFPSAVSAGVLLGLDQQSWVEALGYAGAASPMPGFRTLLERPLSWTKANYDVQTRTGVMAALMAQAGFRARQPLLEDSGEFARMLGSDCWRPELLTEGLGESWVIGETALKPYPCCRLIHPVLDAVADIQSRDPIAPRDVEAVTIETFRSLVDRFADYRPAEIIDAEFSVSYVVAMMLLGHPAGPCWHEPENLSDPRVHALADRVRMEEDSAYTAVHVAERRYGATVHVRLTDGRTLTARRDRPRGALDERLPAEEVRTKFLRLTEPRLGTRAARHAYDGFAHLDELADVREATALLRSATARIPA